MQEIRGTLIAENARTLSFGTGKRSVPSGTLLAAYHFCFGVAELGKCPVLTVLILGARDHHYYSSQVHFFQHKREEIQPWPAVSAYEVLSVFERLSPPITNEKGMLGLTDHAVLDDVSIHSSADLNPTKCGL